MTGRVGAATALEGFVVPTDESAGDAPGSMRSSRRSTGTEPSAVSTRTWTASDSCTTSGSVPERAPVASEDPGSGAWPSPSGSSYHGDHDPSLRLRTQAVIPDAGEVQVAATRRNGSARISPLKTAVRRGSTTSTFPSGRT